MSAPPQGCLTPAKSVREARNSRSRKRYSCCSRPSAACMLVLLRLQLWLLLREVLAGAGCAHGALQQRHEILHQRRACSSCMEGSKHHAALAVLGWDAHERQSVRRSVHCSAATRVRRHYLPRQGRAGLLGTVRQAQAGACRHAMPTAGYKAHCCQCATRLLCCPTGAQTPRPPAAQQSVAPAAASCQSWIATAPARKPQKPREALRCPPHRRRRQQLQHLYLRLAVMPRFASPRPHPGAGLHPTARTLLGRG